MTHFRSVHHLCIIKMLSEQVQNMKIQFKKSLLWSTANFSKYVMYKYLFIHLDSNKTFANTRHPKWPHGSSMIFTDNSAEADAKQISTWNWKLEIKISSLIIHCIM